MMFVVAGRAGTTVTDDFNRADASSLGANYVALGNSGTGLSIASGRAQAPNAPMNQTILWANRHTVQPITDDVDVSAVLITPTVNADIANLYVGLMARCNSAGTMWTEVLLSSTKLWILTRAGVAGSSTYRGTPGSTGVTISSPTSVRFTAVGTLYSVYINGGTTAIATWNDTGAAVPINSTTRYFGILGSSADAFGSPTRGYGIDSWTGRDI
ncbi:hypothetical protein ACFXG4_05080 [Nocardia sp. NPDC059246]|uniref:hypothetical protein n=1 Tax=unclassified Nocardia TaxID=2637762 RepID=UPI0036A5F8BB